MAKEVKRKDSEVINYPTRSAGDIVENSYLIFGSYCDGSRSVYNWEKELIAKVSKSDGGNLTAEMSNFTVTFDKKKISLMTRRMFILKTSVLIESLTCHW